MNEVANNIPVNGWTAMDTLRLVPFERQTLLVRHLLRPHQTTTLVVDRLTYNEATSDQSCSPDNSLTPAELRALGAAILSQGLRTTVRRSVSRLHALLRRLHRTGAQS